MVFLFYNKILLRVLVVLTGGPIALTSWHYVSLSVQKLGTSGARDALAIISFFIAGWLVMVVAEVVDNHYVRVFGCLCVALGAFISYRWLFVVDGPVLQQLPAGPTSMHAIYLSYWAAIVIAMVMFALLVTRLVLDRINYGRTPLAVTRADIKLGPRPEGTGAPPAQPELPPIPVDTAMPVAETMTAPAAPSERQEGPVAKLIGIGGMYLGMEYQLEPGEHTIGRQEAQLMLADDKQVSRHHATLAVAEDQTTTLTDSNSTNGTFVNDQRITSMTLAPGDIIRLGTTLFKVEA